MKYCLLLTFAALWMALYPNGPAFNGQGDRTGSPVAQGTCSSVGCHTGNGFNPVTTIQLLDSFNTPANKYQPGATYTFMISVTGTGSKQYGFQATVLNDTNSNAGIFSGLPATVRSVNVTGYTVVEHKVPSSLGVWSFKWTAPASATGGINFYACGLATNLNGSNTGDQSDTTFLKLDELTSVNPLEYKPFDFSFYNRGNQTLELKVESTEESKLKAQVISIDGAPLLTKALKVNSGTNAYTFDISDIKSGIYFISIGNIKGSIVKKFIKVL